MYGMNMDIHFISWELILSIKGFHQYHYEQISLQIIMGNFQCLCFLETVYLHHVAMLLFASYIICCDISMRTGTSFSICALRGLFENWCACNPSVLNEFSSLTDYILLFHLQNTLLMIC